MSAPRGILVVNANWVGDVLFSTPALRAIKKRFPGARLACVVPARCEPVLRRNRSLDELIVADDDTRLTGIGHAASLTWRLRRGGYDWAVFFHRSKTKAWAAKLAGIGLRAGFLAGTGRDRLLTHRFDPPAGPLHRTDHFLALLAHLGIPADGRVPDFFPDPAAAISLQAKLAAAGFGRGGPYAVIHAGGNWDLKRWPAAHFSRWARLMAESFQGHLVFCGTASEAPLVERVVAEADSARAVSLCGKTSLDELAHLLSSAKLLLSNDSGPIHLAASQGTRIVGLFGPTDERVTGPISSSAVRILRKDVGCQVPCYFRSCDARACLDWTTPEEAVAAAMEVLNAS